VSAHDARHLRDVALAAARAGAAVIAARALDRASLRWEVKQPADFVSDVDRAAEDALAPSSPPSCPRRRCWPRKGPPTPPSPVA
jgi:hypothetical protein